LLVLLGVSLVIAILLIPLGLPGTWVIVGLAGVYDWISHSHAVGPVTILSFLALAGLAEAAEFLLAGRFTRHYGGSRRAAWGAVIGGLIGAVVGVPVPLIGSVIGSFTGAFLGALVAESSRGTQPGAAVSVATGAFLGRVAAAAIKVGIGCVMAVWLFVVAVRG
jgi:uncharacterized protein YqgC (DUF456 family)